MFMNGYSYDKITTTTEMSFGFYPQKPDYTPLNELVRGKSEKQKSKKNLDCSKKDYSDQNNYYSGNPNKKKNSEYYPNAHPNNNYLPRQKDNSIKKRRNVATNPNMAMSSQGYTFEKYTKVSFGPNGKKKIENTEKHTFNNTFNNIFN